jgi:hypothetical protein
MKFVNVEMQKIMAAALLLGVFSLSPLAKAYDRPDSAAPGGLSLSELSSTAGDFSLSFVGDKIVMDGSIPMKCADGAGVSVGIWRGADGKAAPMHSVRFVPGSGCKNLSDADRADRVYIHSPELFGNSRALSDAKIDGGLCVLHKVNGAAGQDACDPVSGQTYTANADAAKAKADQDKITSDAMAKQQKDAIDDRARKEKELIDQLTIACKNGDWVGFGQQIEAAKAFLGDVTKILDKVDGLKQRYFADQISKAKDLDSVKDAYQAYLDAANDAGWDTDEVTGKYVAKRVDMLNAEVADNSKSASARAASIRDLASDLRDLGLMKEKGANLGTAYFNLANHVRDDAGTDLSKLSEAEKYYRESEQYGDNSAKAKVEAEIAKMYNAAADQCISDAKDKGKGFNSCDALAKKAKNAMDGAIKAQGHIKGDDSLEALAAMKQEKLARFGMDGFSMSVTGYGTLNRMGGTYDMTKYQAYTQSQQAFLQQLMMQRMYGVQPTASSSGSTGSFFQ